MNYPLRETDQTPRWLKIDLHSVSSKEKNKVSKKPKEDFKTTFKETKS